MSTNDQPATQTGTQEPEQPITIFAMWCPFRKDGVPVVGNFGAVRPVVIIESSEWKRMLEKFPEMKTTEFRVGTDE